MQRTRDIDSARLQSNLREPVYRCKEVEIRQRVTEWQPRRTPALDSVATPDNLRDRQSQAERPSSNVTCTESVVPARSVRCFAMAAFTLKANVGP